LKPKILVVSAVYPFPRQSGQQQRVFYMLKALRKDFHLTFLTVSQDEKIDEVLAKLKDHADETVVLPSRYMKNVLSHVFYRLLGFFNSIVTGLKFSNYLVGTLELSYSRISSAIDLDQFDLVLFEYWHAHKAAKKMTNVITVLDMHDLLWQSFKRQIEEMKGLPKFVMPLLVKRYKKQEENAWNDFDVLIAINQAEKENIQKLFGNKKRILYAPMGIDLSSWDYSWQPDRTPRKIAYYGSMGGPHNQQDALLCYHKILPVIWRQFPEIEFWIVGSNPPDAIVRLSKDSRVHVTGYVENVQNTLKDMSLVLCPWSGTFGFRSRLVEVMSLGIPVVASNDAIYGMGFEMNKGIIAGKSTDDLGRLAINWLSQEETLNQQSLDARRQVEEKFSFEVTYRRLSAELLKSLN